MKKVEDFDFKEFGKEAIERLKEGAPLFFSFYPTIKLIQSVFFGYH
jgi:hypothetical protein